MFLSCAKLFAWRAFSCFACAVLRGLQLLVNPPALAQTQPLWTCLNKSTKEA